MSSASCTGGCFGSLFGSCLPAKAKPAGQETGDREGLLAGAAKNPNEEIQEHLDLRRVFSRTDISAIPEHSEVNKGSDTNQPQVVAAAPPPSSAFNNNNNLGETNARPPPSPVRSNTPPQLERLFSRGAVRNSPISLNRLFSRGAVNRGSSLGGSWSQRSLRASTADSQNEDYGEEKVETLTDVSSSPLLLGRSVVSTSTPTRLNNGFEEVSIGEASGSAVQSSSTLPQQSSSNGSIGRISSRRRFPELAEAIKKLQQVSDHLVVASLKADTKDHEDHTFSGIFFDVEARTLLPTKFVEIQSISIRGDLGTVSIYSTDRSYEGKQSDQEQWMRHFGPMHIEPSPEKLYELVLSVPIRLAPGSSRGVYVHSELPGDQAIVYDNRRNTDYTFEDNVIRIRPGMAHTSNVPFSPQAPWGGTSFRPHREFVGSMRYGVKLLMWTPEAHHHFPAGFRRSIFTLMCCHKTLASLGSMQSPGLGNLPMDVLFYILNMLPWDWFPNPEEGEVEPVDDSLGSQPFQYGGHVGRIAHLRHMFDSARQELAAAGDGSPSVETRTLLLTDEEEEEQFRLGSDPSGVATSSVHGASRVNLGRLAHSEPTMSDLPIADAQGPGTVENKDSNVSNVPSEL